MRRHLDYLSRAIEPVTTRGILPFVRSIVGDSSALAERAGAERAGAERAGAERAGAERAPIAESDWRNWHAKAGWRAEDFFSDPRAIALCHAIEANDLARIDRLVSAGANVNAPGKGNMTPLLWAFPDHQPTRFRWLLAHGADPNVVLAIDVGKSSRIRAGESVVHLAARARAPEYLQAVLGHGGDANLVEPRWGCTPLFRVITAGVPDRKQRVQLLIDHGADLDHVNHLGSTPAREAVKAFGQYDIALMLLEAGADPGVGNGKQSSRLIHAVVSKEVRLHDYPPRKKADYRALVQWLVDHGESVEEARKDLDRWRERTGRLPPQQLAEFRRRKIAERIAREQAEANAANRHGTR